MSLTTSRDPLAGNAFGPAVGDMLGTAPKPFPAKPCSLMIGAARDAHIQVYAQFPLRDLLCTIRMREVLSDSVGKNAGFANLAAFLSSFSPDKSLPSTGDADGTRARTLHCLHVDTRRSKATCCTGLARLENAFRNVDSYGRPQPCRHREFFDKRPCTHHSNISDANAMEAWPLSIEHKIVASSFCHFLGGRKS